MKPSKDELTIILNGLLLEKEALDIQLMTLSVKSDYLTQEYNRVNSLIGDTKNRIKEKTNV